MTKVRDYHLWDEDDYDPYAPVIDPKNSKGKKRKNGYPSEFKKAKSQYEEDEDF